MVDILNKKIFNLNFKKTKTKKTVTVIFRLSTINKGCKKKLFVFVRFGWLRGNNNYKLFYAITKTDVCLVHLITDLTSKSLLAFVHG